MTDITAAGGVTAPAVRLSTTAAFYLLALAIVAIAAGATVAFGLGGLIMTAVIAAWVCLGFLVVLTMGG